MTGWMLKTALGAIAAVSLSACGGDEGGGSYEAAPSEMRLASAPVAADQSFQAKKVGPQTETDATATPGSYLAYSYSMGVEAHKSAITPLMKTHEQACVAAGPQVCQVLNASVNQRGDEHVYAYLNLRAKPEWLETFRAQIATDTEKAGGRMTENSVRAEDLTEFIVDTEARLEAKIALRERIRNLLEKNEGSLSDILAAERALSDVQGEIDSMTARLKAARQRVDMSSLSISYQSDPETATGLFAPLAEAFGDFARLSVEALAGAVVFVARSWPFFIILLVALGIGRAWLRRRAK